MNSFNTDDRDAYFFDRNAEPETPTVFRNGHPLYKCTAPGCNEEPHIASETYECPMHTLQSCQQAWVEVPCDYWLDEIAKWVEIAGVSF